MANKCCCCPWWWITQCGVTTLVVVITPILIFLFLNTFWKDLNAFFLFNLHLCLAKIDTVKTKRRTTKPFPNAPSSIKIEVVGDDDHMIWWRQPAWKCNLIASSRSSKTQHTSWNSIIHTVSQSVRWCKPTTSTTTERDLCHGKQIRANWGRFVAK